MFLRNLQSFGASRVTENIYIVEVTDIKVIEKSDLKAFISGRRKGYFSVIETLKGSAEGSTYIESDDEPICCRCGMKVEKGDRYLVFQSSGSSAYYSSCGFTRPISETSDLPEVIKSLVQVYKATELFTGIYIREQQLFIGDDGTRTKIFELELENYYSEMVRVSFEGLRMKSGKLLASNLHDEHVLSQEEINAEGNLK